MSAHVEQGDFVHFLARGSYRKICYIIPLLGTIECIADIKDKKLCHVFIEKVGEITLSPGSGELPVGTPSIPIDRYVQNSRDESIVRKEINGSLICVSSELLEPELQF